MNNLVDQYDRAVAWIITGLVSLVTFLFGWIYKQNLDRITEKFIEMQTTFNERLKQLEDLFNDRLKQSESSLLVRLDAQDKDLKVIEGFCERLHDRLDADAKPWHSRQVPRGTIRDRGQLRDQERNDSYDGS